MSPYARPVPEDGKEPGGLYAEFCTPMEVGAVTIYLGPTLPSGSSGLPEDGARLP